MNPAPEALIEIEEHQSIRAVPTITEQFQKRARSVAHKIGTPNPG